MTILHLDPKKYEKKSHFLAAVSTIWEEGGGQFNHLQNIIFILLRSVIQVLEHFNVTKA